MYWNAIEIVNIVDLYHTNCIPWEIRDIIMISVFQMKEKTPISANR